MVKHTDANVAKEPCGFALACVVLEKKTSTRHRMEHSISKETQRNARPRKKLQPAMLVVCLNDFPIGFVSRKEHRIFTLHAPQICKDGSLEIGLTQVEKGARCEPNRMGVSLTSREREERCLRVRGILTTMTCVSLRWRDNDGGREEGTCEREACCVTGGLEDESKETVQDRASM